MFETLCSAPSEAHNAPFGEAVRRAVFEVYKMTRKTKQSGDFVAETMTGMRSEKSSVAVSSQESEVWLIMVKNPPN